MNSLNLETAIMSAAVGTVEFAINWLVQSTLLIIAGLLLARYFQRQGSAAQSLIYRTTLAAVILCPIATWALGRIGVSGWSITLAPAYQMSSIDPAEISITPDAASARENLPTVSSTPDTVKNSTANLLDGSNPSKEPPFSANLTTKSSSNTTTPPVNAESINAIESTAANQLNKFELHYWLARVSPFVLLAWVAISGCLLVRLASSWWRMSSLLRGADRADEATTQLCRRLAHELSASAPDVMISPFIPSPCLAGIGLVKRASILLPNNDLNLPMRDVLVHELAHLRRFDCHWNLARQIATAIYWFQPLIWVLSRRIEIAAEEVCDDIVVSTGANRHDYAHRLVDIAELSADVSAAAVAAAGVGIVSLRSMLARRVERILDTSRSLSTRVGHLLMISVISVGMAGTVTVGLVGIHRQKAVAGEPAQRDEAETHITKDAAHPGKVLTQVHLPDGNAAAGTDVAVTAYDSETGELTIVAELKTGADGSCLLDERILPTDISSKNVRFLIARRDGYGIGWKVLGGPSTPPLNGQSTIDVKLHEEGIVEGKLIDVDGQPAAGESLQIEMIMNPASSTRMFENSVGFRGKPDMQPPAAWVPGVTTDASGRFKLTGLPKDHGIYLSLVKSQRFAPQDIAINTGQPEQRGPRDGTYRALVKNIKPGEEGIIAIDPAKIFTGTITYEDSGEPVPGAKVSIWASQQEFGSMMSVDGVTDAQGKYRVLPNPGIRFGVTAYPPSGVPYMARQTERITWENSDLTREVNIKVPRVSLVRGRVIEEGTGTPVEGATITFEAGGSQSGMPENVVTGWEAQQTTDANGNFTFAVPYGRGTLLVKKKGANYILQHKLSREIQSGKPGGSRVYAHALHEVNTSKDNDSIEVEIRIKPGREVSGKIVDEQGKPIDYALLPTNLDVWDYSGEWRGVSGPTLGGTFRLNGLTADQEHVVHFLDPHQKLGATVKLRATDQPANVVLKPCGSAKAKFVLDREDRQFFPMLYFVLTSGESKYDFNASKAGKTLADSDFVANVDRINYGNAQKEQEGLNRHYTFPALIPGATYRLMIGGGIDGPYKDFTVKSGETLDLGEFTPKFEE